MEVDDENNSTQILEIVKTDSTQPSTPKINKLKLQKKIAAKQDKKTEEEDNSHSISALNKGKGIKTIVAKVRNLRKQQQKDKLSSLGPRKNKIEAKERIKAIIERKRRQMKMTEKKKTIRFFAKPHTKTEFLPWSKEILEKYKKDFYSLTWKAKAMDADENIDNKVFTVEKIQMASDDSMDIDSEIKKVYEKTKHTQNHAKWAVSTDKEIVCLGDLNHDPTQLKRGGMIICFENKTVANYFGNRIAEYNKYNIILT